MYHHSIAPIALGFGGGGLTFLDIAPFWLILGTFALIACASAIRRIIPKIYVNNSIPDAPRVPAHRRI